MAKKRTRRTKAEIEAAKRMEETLQKHEQQKSEGLGDTIEKITEATGIKKVVKWIAGEDCGCDKRKETLNKLFPYRQPNCLTEDEYAYLDEFFKNHTNTITIKHQERLLVIYNRTLNQKETMSSCTQCWKERINQLKKMYNEYKKDQETSK